uniref:EamA domain-containing protein n=1 Tax=Heligmosomoides polygyrus TaxID=6339 RepID=A0A183FXP7_HELPZ
LSTENAMRVFSFQLEVLELRDVDEVNSFKEGLFLQWPFQTHFYAPYTMMWFNTNFMMLCYPAFLSQLKTTVFRDASSIFGSRGVHPRTLFLYVSPFLLFWIGANYAYSASLLYISASVATSISSCNAAMVYLLAVLILHDKFVIMKVLSVLLAVAGVVVISLGGEMKTHWKGIALSVASAASAALYKVFFKRVLGSANLGQVSLFMTCLGFVNLICNWVPALVLMLTDVEHIEIDYVPWGPVVGAAVLSLLFNFLINFGIALLHPLVVSVGMLMGIPLSTVIDVLFRHEQATAYFIGGTVLIILSFVLIVFPYELLRGFLSHDGLLGTVFKIHYLFTLLVMVTSKLQYFEAKPRRN